MRLIIFSPMAITLDQIAEETRQWKAEIQRRVTEIEAGTEEGIPVEDSLARVRKIAGL